MVLSTVCQVERGVDGLAHLPERLQLGDGAGQLGRARLHLLEQPRVLDGDHGLVGKGLDQFDLTVGKRPYGIPGDGNDADHDIVPEKRHGERRAPSAAPLEIAFRIARIREDIRDVDRATLDHCLGRRRA